MDFHISKISQVPQSEVKIRGSRDAFIQWLVTSDHGAHYAVRKFTLLPHGRIGMHLHKYQETVVITKGNVQYVLGIRYTSYARVILSS